MRQNRPIVSLRPVGKDGIAQAKLLGQKKAVPAQRIDKTTCIGSGYANSALQIALISG
jgi:hypothetical protein